MPAKKLTTQQRTENAVASFWRKVLKGPGCWEWTASKKPFGYGQLNVLGKMVNAHKFAWELVRGKVPEGLVVRHKCDNPSCCNPDHMEIGTQFDNTRDSLARGRIKSGDKHYNRKLTGEQVRQIREDFRAGLRFHVLAARYGVSDSTISDAVKRKTWKHIGD